MKAFSHLKSRFGHIFIFVMFTIALQGCIVSGFNAKKSDTNYLPDTSLVTGSVSQLPSKPADPIELADQQIIRDKIAALTSANKFVGPLNWENDTTGSQGTITHISEKKLNNQTCRSFQTTRAAFDGVALYQGNMCQVTDNIWNMASFVTVE